MDDKKFIGMYHNDSELMTKIDDLKTQGIDGENIYVIAQDDSDVTMFQGMKYGDVQTAPESWFDRFMDFLTGEDHVRSMLKEAGVADADMDNYYYQVQNGGKLLYVDEGELNRLHARNETNFGLLDEGTDPNLGANRVSEFEENELYRSDYSTGAFQDSNLFDGADENYGRVGGEALRSGSNYETPPSNYYGVQNRYDASDREVNETVKREEARLEQSGEVDVQDEFVDAPTMRRKYEDERF